MRAIPAAAVLGLALVGAGPALAQSPCHTTWFNGPSSVNTGAEAGSIQLPVWGQGYTGGLCGAFVNATSNDPWWIAATGAQANAGQSINVTWAQNLTAYPRTGTVSVFALLNAAPVTLTFTVNQAAAATGPFTSFGPHEGWSGPYYGSRGTFFADVTGDGRADAIVVNDWGVTVRRSSGFDFEPNEGWTEGAYYGTRGTYFADVTGDGMADAIVVNDWGVTVRRSNGSRFDPNEGWTEGAYYGTHGTWFADVTGDGKADAIVANSWGFVVRRSTGTFFAPNEWWGYLFAGVLRVHFADVTGDGRADQINGTSSRVEVLRSSGTFFYLGEGWTANPYYGTRVTTFADVTGDGRSDAIVVNEAIVGRPSNGSQFTGNELWTLDAFYGTRGTEFADVTGDGRADAIVVNDFGITVRRSVVQ